MASPLFESVTGRVVSTALDGVAARHRAYAQNLANVDTPGYRARNVAFEDTLRKWRENVGDLGRAPQAPPTAPRVIDAGAAARRADGNSVDIDAQMTELAANGLTYETLVASANMRAQRLKSVIHEGRR